MLTMEEGLWLGLLSECRSESPRRQLLVLGDDDDDKASLVESLGGGGGTRGSGLQYRHLSDPDGENTMGVWTLDSHPLYRNMLRFALDAESLPSTLALLVAPMSRPWDILDAVVSWTRVLWDHIRGLEMEEGELERRQGAVLARYREYVEPGLSLYGSLAADNTREIEENLGLELVVVVTQTEAMRSLRTDWGYEEEHFDFIQLRLREFCLRHGAALFYVSAREDRNCDLLRKYLLHRHFRLPFRLPGVLSDRESLLVPAGWDTWCKVRFLADTLPTIHPDTPYGDVVFRPSRRSDAKAPMVRALGDQEFLCEVQAALDRPGSEAPPEATATRGEATATVVQRNVARRMARGGSPKRASEDTLSNFFHSLLNRRTSAPARSSSSSSCTEADQENRQLPEYFLSSSQSSLEEGPPLRTLPERPDTLLANGPDLLTNGETERSAEGAEL